MLLYLFNFTNFTRRSKVNISGGMAAAGGRKVHAGWNWHSWGVFICGLSEKNCLSRNAAKEQKQILLEFEKIATVCGDKGQTATEE